MAQAVLYCGKCGRLIPPEEAEADDFAAAGGEPLCPACLQREDPGHCRRVREARATRLRLRAQEVVALRQARPPAQLYPPPGTEEPLSPTSTAVRVLREELRHDWDEGTAAEDSAGGDARGSPAAGLPSGPASASRHLIPALKVVLILSLLGVVALIFWPPRSEGPAGPDAPLTPPGPGAGTRDPARIAPMPSGGVAARQKELDEVELIVTLAREDPDPDTAAGAVRKLRALAERTRDPARSAALEWAARYEALLDARARQAAREAAERAEDLIAQELFTPAAVELQAAAAALPDSSPWAKREGRPRLAARLKETLARKAQLLADRKTRFQAALAQGQEAPARALAEALQRHAEPEFRALGEGFVKDLAALEITRRSGQRQRDEAARAAWAEFFRAYDQALAGVQLDHAAGLCRPAPDSALRGGGSAMLTAGGVARPDEVLAGFAAEVDGIKGLYSAALQAAPRVQGRTLRLGLLNGAVEGRLTGVEGRLLLMLAGGRAEVKVPVERLSCEGLATLLADTPREGYWIPLGTLAFARGELQSKDAEAALAERYQQVGRALPPHWAQRFELSRREQLRRALAPKVAAVQAALDRREVAALRDALAALRTLTADTPDLLTPEERELVAAAEKLAGPGKVQALVFQNGRRPTADFAGFRVDQISAYYQVAERTSADTRRGLKLGSYQDLHRLLLRFEGLERSLGMGRVRTATLELYQTEAAPSDGAVVGVYRLKKAWLPGAGTWLNADQKNKLAWQRPGAGGPEDAAAVPEYKLTLDGQKGLWRSWDVTAYVRDVTEGRAQNLGLLLRVVKDEPRYFLRFYPDTDLEGHTDPDLRPRLRVEVEAAPE